MGDDERARNGVRGLRTGAQHAVNAMGQPMMGPATMVSPEVARLKETINPAHFDCNPSYARFFIIKSYSEDDVHKSIKYGVWASTDTGNRRLDSAFREMAGRGPIYLFFSVNASGQFSGMAQMESPLDYTKKFGCWAQDKWAGTFMIKWTFIKDIPNAQFRHILLSNNEGKPVTNSRDTQEVLLEPGAQHAPARPPPSPFLSFSLPASPCFPQARSCCGFSTSSARARRSSTTLASTTRGKSSWRRGCSSRRRGSRRRRRRRRCRTRCSRSKLCSRTQCSPARTSAAAAAAAARRAAARSSRRRRPTTGSSAADSAAG